MTDILDVSGQRLTSLPNNLPPSLQVLLCDYNQLTSLPDKLPPSLQTLWCHNNRLISLPDNLPPSLRQFYCLGNKLTSLPNNLPSSLQWLSFYNNKLTSLPDNLPSSLHTLYCSNNTLTILPDLPDTLTCIALGNNPLEANYPLIFTFQPEQASEIVAYVNARNREMRRERMRAIDPQNQILERYMQRAMHPSRLAALAQDETMDVDNFMEAYVAAL